MLQRGAPRSTRSRVHGIRASQYEQKMISTICPLPVCDGTDVHEGFYCFNFRAFGRAVNNLCFHLPAYVYTVVIQVESPVPKRLRLLGQTSTNCESLQDIRVT